MTGFSTLLWLEVRKHGMLMGFLWLGVLAWYLLAGQLLEVVRREEGPEGAALAVLAASIGLGIGGTMTWLAFQGTDFAREHRAGRLGLLLGAPIAGGWHILTRVVVSLVFLSVFHWGMWWVMTTWLAKVGVVLPLGMMGKIWLFGLAGLPLVLMALFIGLISTAYIPRRATAIAGFVAFIGLIQILEFSLRAIWNSLYTLPAWSLPAPRIAANPEIQIAWALFPGLPGEVFLIFVLLSGALFYLLSRIWPEVEA